MTAPLHHTATFTGIANVPIFYQKWLPADGVRRGSVVIVHGLGEHGGRYTNLIERLLPEGYALYAIDHQGFGQSGGRRGHVERFEHYLPDVRHVVDLARQEQGHLPVALFGHSMGGLIGLHYLMEQEQSVDCAVISAPALLANPNRWLVRLMRLINWVRPTFVLTRPGSGTAVSRDPEVIRHFIEDPLFVGKSSARWVVEILAAQPKIAARADEITLPILVVQGLADSVVVPAATAEFFERVSSPDKTLLTYEGYFHELHNDVDKEKPLGDVAEWLNQRMSG